MAILMRRGLHKDFDPTQMLPGEWAVAIDADSSKQVVWMCFAPGQVKRMGTLEDFDSDIQALFKKYLDEIENNVVKSKNHADESEEYAEAAELSAKNAKTSQQNAQTIADSIQNKIETGYFKGDKGETGDPGESGVTISASGLISLSVDANGDLWVHTADDTANVPLEYDSATGDLYYITED